MFPVMPRSALEHVDVDYCVAGSEIPGLLVRLTTAPATEREGGASSRELEIEVDIAKEKDALDAGLGHLASPSIYACPEGHGVLLQLKEGDRIRELLMTRETLAGR
jgi:two-component system, chemotaxis family, protein-glutamate methylesterase/glutaminase